MRFTVFTFLLLTLTTACMGGRSRGTSGPSDPMDPMDPVEDGAVSVTDGGTAGEDAGTHEGHDAGHVIDEDAGEGLADAGLEEDAGEELHDAGPPPTCAPSSSNVAIVEVMIASQMGSLDRGEWFEIWNFGGCTVDLAGLVIESPTTSGVPVTHTIAAGAIPPNGHFVLAVDGDPARNNGVAFDYVYGSGTSSDINLGNGGDELLLRYGTEVIDRVSWPSYAFAYGRSRQLTASMSPAYNDDWTLWCDGMSSYAATTAGTFYGTPRTANAHCL